MDLRDLMVELQNGSQLRVATRGKHQLVARRTDYPVSPSSVEGFPGVSASEVDPPSTSFSRIVTVLSGSSNMGECAECSNG